MNSSSSDIGDFSNCSFSEAVYKIKWMRCMNSNPVRDEDIAKMINISMEQFKSYMYKKEDAPNKLINALFKEYGFKNVILTQLVSIEDIRVLHKDSEETGLDEDE